MKKGTLCLSRLHSKKRGQLTIFIIITIIVILGILLYSFTKNDLNTEFNENFISGKGLSLDLSIIRSNIFDCIKTTQQEALVVIGIQGGNYNKQEKYFLNKELENYNTFFSYLYYEGDYFTPTKETVENSISDYINYNLPKCLNQKDYPLNTTIKQSKASTTLTENEVTTKIDLQIIISSEDKITNTIDLSKETFSHSSKLLGMIEIAQYLTNYHEIDPKYYCINCLGLLAYERGVDVDIIPFKNENNTKQVIIHENTTFAPNMYTFNYLNKYTGFEKSPIYDD